MRLLLFFFFFDRTLDLDKLDIKIEINDYEAVEYNFDDIEVISNILKFNPNDILNMTTGLVPALPKKSVVEIKYLYQNSQNIKNNSQERYRNKSSL
ncbi:hypothetical protein ATZ36_13500 [Candidatus Endomicrobiellum trichonymphae]|uniref:Uncharacterized protein n=1 Tax=Endomicrobium trichonymphae TaxID=1408204 RepID=A0A1E5IMG4_ENDTX|nr:hypothetical protein ATZ36_13500 [Candidatus Endomicrobium trichonymphae]